GVEQCARRAAELATRCHGLRATDDDSGVRWVEARMQHWQIQFTPFEVADRLRKYMTATPCAWIFTSATLAVGEDFSHFTPRIGQPEARTVRIDSPFDYRRQARLYLPEGISDPSSPSHTREVVGAAWPLLEAAGGRAFMLFTSHRALQEGAVWLKQKMAQAAA